jgi:hypothetical protein
MNKAMSLIEVLVALPTRLFSVPLADVSPHWRGGKPAGREPGWGVDMCATWATRMRSATLDQMLAVITPRNGPPLRLR